ncbi:MAG TPA: PadR family transcriptional regulator [Vicinamibacterales bacterium]|nr:PadR family transcriptional regulator [Vicinamibacterales bacterium]
MRRMSVTTLSVLHAIRDGVAYGFDILDVTGLESGTVYPILSRLENDGFVRSTWEAEARAHADGRPARRYYAITAAGRTALEAATKHYAQLLPAFGRGKRTR